MSNKYGRQYTAQPYGLNTPGAFAFVYNIMYTVFFAGGGGDEAFIKGYKVALAANFVTGLIGVFLGILGPAILKVVPPAGLLVPIAGIGFAFLGLEQLTNSIAAPIVGYSTIIWVYLGWYANIRIGYGRFRLPEAFQVILVGVILGWATGLNTPEPTKEAAKLVRWWGPGTYDFVCVDICLLFGMLKCLHGSYSSLIFIVLFQSGLQVIFLRISRFWQTTWVLSFHLGFLPQLLL
jgi:AGZA family xanthine/uracil permease-like MFS transporter